MHSTEREEGNATMKMSAEHVEILRDAITPHDTAEIRQAYRDGNFPRADACKNRDARYRWDLFWHAHHRHGSTIAPVLDAGYKDAHIDTALRSIVPPLA